MFTHTDNPSYLRMLSDSELIEEARYCHSTQATSALVQTLAERLADASVAVIREYKEEISDLEQSLSDAEDERDEAQEELRQAEAKIEELEAKLEDLEGGEDQ